MGFLSIETPNCAITKKKTYRILGLDDLARPNVGLLGRC